MKKGEPSRKSDYVRDQRLNFRCSQGLKETLKIMATEGAYKDKSEADIVHEAVQKLALKTVNKKYLPIINTIQ